MKSLYQNDLALLWQPLSASCFLAIGNYLNIFGLLWRMKIVTIVGTRPNFMKAAPLIYELKKHNISPILIHTGQHYDFKMSKLFFDELRLPKPDEYLNCAENSGPGDIKGPIKQSVKEALKRHNPDLVIVV